MDFFLPVLCSETFICFHYGCCYLSNGLRRSQPELDWRVCLEGWLSELGQITGNFIFIWSFSVRDNKKKCPQETKAFYFNILCVWTFYLLSHFPGMIDQISLLFNRKSNKHTCTTMYLQTLFAINKIIYEVKGNTICIHLKFRESSVLTCPL